MIDAPPAHIMTVTSTSYCDVGIMADGSRTRWGSVAMNLVPLGKRVRLLHRSFHGRHKFVVRDHIGWGSQLDFWTNDCGEALKWGRRVVKVQVG